ncbi:RNA-binding protein 39 [Tetrabaena socialis]|uniref:RNA-binding protein 39 n=1 Tax=Tetrabaena socialis TaxID=47790 RepID=A0A2J8A069_9CHLO|nr:RNA-binding protein 39 [Tetrabaena socialis]|eukprot:PNH05905.1 RNA-binding protein 39 [Tetrabaena socialis]
MVAGRKAVVVNKQAVANVVAAAPAAAAVAAALVVAKGLRFKAGGVWPWACMAIEGGADCLAVLLDAPATGPTLDAARLIEPRVQRPATMYEDYEYLERQVDAQRRGYPPPGPPHGRHRDVPSDDENNWGISGRYQRPQSRLIERERPMRHRSPSPRPQHHRRRSRSRSREWVRDYLERGIRPRTPPRRRSPTPPEDRLAREVAREKERELRELERATRTVFAYGLSHLVDERDLFDLFSKPPGAAGGGEAEAAAALAAEVEADVRDECSRFGPLMHVWVDPRSKGFVYLRFTATAAAEAAHRTLHGRWYGGRQILAEYQFAQTYDSHFKLKRK